MVVCVICGKAEKKGIIHCKHRMREIDIHQYRQAKKNLKAWRKEARRIRRRERKGE